MATDNILTVIGGPATHRHSALELARENGGTPGEGGLLGRLGSNGRGEPDPFWDTAQIDELRWDAQYPFQLLIVEHMGGGKYSEPIASGVFTLPIPPQAMTISTPFAIATTVTQGGIVEEHNGAPIRNITLRGTTGVLPGRKPGVQVGSPTPLESVFAGTINAVQGVIQAGEQLSQIARSLAGGQAFQPNIIEDPDITNTDPQEGLAGTTGYGQFLLLRAFLENYANQKKRQAGKTWRLAFAHWKTQDVYLVTPVNFDVSQDASSPFEYTYTLSLKAWRRISLKKSAEALSPVSSDPREPGRLQQILTGLSTARRALYKVEEVIRAVGQDVDNALFEPLRNSILFLKDAAGIPVVLADLPMQIVRDLKTTIIEAAGLSASATSAFAAFGSLGDQLGAEFASIQSTFDDLAVQSGKKEARGGAQSQTSQALRNGAAHPANKILENPGDHFDVFEKVQLGSLNVPPAVTKKVIAERERIRNLQRLDFEQYRDNMQALLEAFCDAVGVGSTTVDRVYGRATTTTTKTPTESDYEAIFQMNAAILAMNQMAVSGHINTHRTTVLEYVAGLAGRSGISFQVPQSQFQVPMMYGATLEVMAGRYLGDPDRWHEIAALNRLRPPYVDEVGFDLPLLVNGAGNEVVVSTAENLFVGQPVWIYSSLVNKTKRHITGIRRVSPTNHVIQVDGDNDLAIYKVSASAQLHAFLPDTVNSQMLLSIPSTDPSNIDDLELRSIPGLDQFETLLEVGGVDLLLTSTGDAAITPDGDWKLAVGMANLVQQIRVFVGTPRGSLYRHPDWGLAVQVGQSTADMSARDILKSLGGLTGSNPAFKAVRSASVNKTGPTARISALIEVRGVEKLLPISLELKRG